MEPPYPRVAPTYKQGDDSNMIKLDLLMFLPLERSVSQLLSKLKKDNTNSCLNSLQYVVVSII